jgi:hypothetical protein
LPFPLPLPLSPLLLPLPELSPDWPDESPLPDEGSPEPSPPPGCGCGCGSGVGVGGCCPPPLDGGGWCFVFGACTPALFAAGAGAAGAGVGGAGVVLAALVVVGGRETAGVSVATGDSCAGVTRAWAATGRSERWTTLTCTGRAWVT